MPRIYHAFIDRKLLLLIVISLAVYSTYLFLIPFIQQWQFFSSNKIYESQETCEQDSGKTCNYYQASDEANTLWPLLKKSGWKPIE